MLFDTSVQTVDDEQPWSVCSAKKWVRADHEAQRELYAKYTKGRVHDVLREYASALAGGAHLPELKNPRSLLFNWRGILGALAESVTAGPEALSIALAEGRPTMARTIELGLRARLAWQRAVVAASGDKKPKLPIGPLVVSFMDAYLDRMPPASDFICGWVQRTDEPWQHRHPWYTRDGYHMALEHCGNGDIWYGLVGHVERYLAG